MEKEKITPIKETTESKETTENVLKEKYSIKILPKILIALIVILVIIACVYFGLRTYSNDIKIGTVTINNPLGITDEYLTENFNQNGFDQFDSCKVHKVASMDFNYNGYDKLVLCTVDVSKNGVTYQRAGLLFVNRKKDAVSGFTISNNIAYILYAICKEPCDQEQALKICSEYIQENGVEVFLDTSNIDMINNLTNIVTVKTARKYVEEFLKKDIASKLDNNSEYVLLYTKGTAVISYVAFKETGLVFNTSYPIDERMYNYFKSSYSYRDTLNTLRYVYGDPYILKTTYSYIKVGDSSIQGSKATLNEVKKYLNVEEMNEISTYNDISTSTKETTKVEDNKLQDNSVLEENKEPNSDEKIEQNKENEEAISSSKNESNNYTENEYKNSNTNTTTSKAEYSDASNSNKETISNSESTEYNTTAEEEPDPINVYKIHCFYPKFADAKAEMEKSGLKVNEILKEIEVEYLYYSEENDDTWDYEGNKTSYKIGETINIIHKKYKKVASRIRTRIDFNKIFDDTGKLPLLKKDTSKENWGIQVYIDDKMAFTYKFSKYYSTSQAYEYPFEPDKTVHIKLVAPSSCPYSYYVYYGKADTPDEYGEEWIIKEYDVNTNDIPNYFDLYTLIKWY